MKSQIHLLLISLHADPTLPAGINTFGGGHMYPYELLVGLSKENFRVSLITRKFNENMPDIDSINDSSTIYRLDYSGHVFHDKRDFYTLRDVSYNLSVQLLEKYHLCPDIIHSLYWNSGYLAMQLSQKLHIPYVHSPISIGAAILERNAKEIEPNRISVETEVFKNASRILSITESEKKGLIEYYHIDARCVSVIGRPVAQEYLYPAHDNWGNVRNQDMSYYIDSDMTHSYQFSEEENWWEKKAFIYVGRIDANKGIHHIVNAWLILEKQYKTACPPLWIVGGTPDEINRFHTEQNLNLKTFENDGRIIWWGRLTAEGISTLYMRSLALIMHSKYEPGGRVNIEALSAGIPIIATHCGFAQDTISAWNTGFLVDYGDEEYLAYWMSMFIRQPYLSTSMGRNAKLTAYKNNQKWGFMEHHIQIYQQVMEGTYSERTKFDEKLESHLLFINTYPASMAPKRCLSSDIVGCFTWNMIENQTKITVLQPYIMLNLLRILDTKRYNKLIKISFETYIHFYEKIPSCMDSYDDTKHLIYIKTKEVLNYNKKNFQTILRFILENQKIWIPELKYQTEKIIQRSDDLYEAFNAYQQCLQSYGLFTAGDFSIRLEAKWILQYMSQNIGFKNVFDYTIIEYIEKCSKHIYNTSIVMGGMIYPKSLCYDLKDIYILNPGFLHPVESGYDSARLLLLTVGSSTNKEEWRSIIKYLPKEIYHLSLTWAVICSIKKMILNHAMRVKSNEQPIILKQIHILISLDY